MSDNIVVGARPFVAKLSNCPEGFENCGRLTGYDVLPNLSFDRIPNREELSCTQKGLDYLDDDFRGNVLDDF